MRKKYCISSQDWTDKTNEIIKHHQKVAYRKRVRYTKLHFFFGVSCVYYKFSYVSVCMSACVWKYFFFIKFCLPFPRPVHTILKKKFLDFIFRVHARCMKLSNDMCMHIKMFTLPLVLLYCTYIHIYNIFWLMCINLQSNKPTQPKYLFLRIFIFIFKTLFTQCIF